MTIPLIRNPIDLVEPDEARLSRFFPGEADVRERVQRESRSSRGVRRKVTRILALVAVVTLSYAAVLVALFVQSQILEV